MNITQIRNSQIQQSDLQKFIPSPVTQGIKDKNNSEIVDKNDINLNKN